MKDCIETSVAIANELAENLSKIDRDAVEKLMEAILGANRIFSAACGRSLLMIRGLAMRLMHLGPVSYTHLWTMRWKMSCWIPTSSIGKM